MNHLKIKLEEPVTNTNKRVNMREKTNYHSISKEQINDMRNTYEVKGSTQIHYFPVRLCCCGCVMNNFKLFRTNFLIPLDCVDGIGCCGHVNSSSSTSCFL